MVALEIGEFDGACCGIVTPDDGGAEGGGFGSGLRLWICWHDGRVTRDE